MGASPQVQATGNVTVNTFVVADVNNNDSVVQASATNLPLFGVAGNYPNNFPVGGSLGAQAATYAAQSGQPCQVHIADERCYLQIGSGGCLPGSLLTSDGNGNGIIATTGNYYGAQSLATLTSGGLAEVIVRFGKI